MKYIRTKDGRIIGFKLYNKDLDLVVYLSQFANYQGEYAPIKQADTIEKLCDLFVLVNESSGLLPSFEKSYHDFSPYLDVDIRRGEKPKHIEIYGAVCTKRGIIYVAKMNDNGELELL